MHDGMQYDPIQGHEPLKVWNSTIFKGYLLPLYIGGWQLTTDSQIRGEYLSVLGVDFWFLMLPVFMSRDFEVGSK